MQRQGSTAGVEGAQHRGGVCLLVATVWRWASLWTSLSFGPLRQLSTSAAGSSGLPPKCSFLSYSQDVRGIWPAATAFPGATLPPLSRWVLPLQQGIFPDAARPPEPQAGHWARKPGTVPAGLSSRGGSSGRAGASHPAQPSPPLTDPGLGQGGTQRPLTGHLR